MAYVENRRWDTGEAEGFWDRTKHGEICPQCEEMVQGY